MQSGLICNVINILIYSRVEFQLNLIFGPFTCAGRAGQDGIRVRLVFGPSYLFEIF